MSEQPSVRSQRGNYDASKYEGYTRSKLEADYQDVETKLKDERLRSQELQWGMKDEQRAREDAFNELKSIRRDLESELEAKSELKKEFTKLRDDFEERASEARQLKRDRKAYQQQIAALEQQLAQAALATKKKAQQADATHEALWEMKRERLIDEERDQFYQDLALGETQRHIEDLRKKMQELNRGFDLERKRFETQKTVDSNTIRRVHLEKEMAQKELSLVEGKLAEKRQQLVDAFEEIEKLEAELQECDDEIKRLHDRCLFLEEEKINQRRHYETQQKELSETMRREVANFNDRLRDLKKVNAKLQTELDNNEKDRDAFEERVKEKEAQKLNDLRIDLETERESYKDLHRQMLELTRDKTTTVDPTREKLRAMVQQNEELAKDLEAARLHVENTTKAHEYQLRESFELLDRVRKTNEQLQSENQLLGGSHATENQNLTHETVLGLALSVVVKKIEDLEFTNRTLKVAAEELKAERELLIVNEQRVKAELASLEQEKVTQLAEMELEVETLKIKIASTEKKLSAAQFTVKEQKGQIDALNELPPKIEELKAKQTELLKNIQSVATDAERKQEDLNSQIIKLQRQLENNKDSTKALKSENQKLKDQLARVREREFALDDEYKRVEVALAASERKLAESEGSVLFMQAKFGAREVDLTKELKKTQEQLNNQARAFNADIEKLQKQLRQEALNAEHERRAKDDLGEKGQRAAKDEIAKLKSLSADYKIQIDALKQAQEKSRSDLKDADLNLGELRDEHEKTVISLDTAKESLDRTLKELQSEKARLLESGAAIAALTIEKTTLAKSLEAAKEQLKKEQEELAGLKSSASASVSDGKSLQTEIASLKQLLAGAQQEKANAEKKAREIDSENSALLLEQKRLAEQVTALASYKEKSEEFAKQVAELKEKLEAAEKEAERALQQKDSAVKLQQKELDALKRDIEAGKSTVTTSHATIEESKKQYEKLKEEYEALRKQNTGLSSDLNAQVKELNTAKAEMEKRVNAATAQIQSDAKKLVDAKEIKIRELEKALAALEADVAGLTQREALALQSASKTGDEKDKLLASKTQEFNQTLKTKEDLIRAKEDRVQQVSAELEAARSDAGKAKASADERAKKLSAELEEAQRQLLASKSESAQGSEKLQGEVTRLTSELQHASKKLKEGQEQALERQRALEKDLEYAKKTVNDLTKAQQSQAGQGDSKDAQIKKVQAELEAAKKERDAISGKVSALEKDLQAAKEREATALKEAKEAKEKAVAQPQPQQASQSGEGGEGAKQVAALQQELSAAKEKAEKDLKAAQEKATSERAALEKQLTELQQARQAGGGGVGEALKPEQAATTPDKTLKTTPSKSPAPDKKKGGSKSNTPVKGAASDGAASESEAEPSAAELQREVERLSSHLRDTKKLLKEKSSNTEVLSEKLKSAEKKAAQYQQEKNRLQKELNSVAAERSAVMKEHKKQRRSSTKLDNVFAEQESPEGTRIVRLQAILRGNHQRRQYKQVRARYNTVNEILHTEQSYCDSLELIVTAFLKPLAILGYISAENLQLIFQNVEEILAKNTELLNLIRARVENWTVDSVIGDLFAQNIKSLAPHQIYVTGFTKASEVLSSCTKAGQTNANELSIFLNVVKTLPQCGQQLSNLLIMPVQRIPRYVLLLSDLQKRTAPDHADFALLTKAVEEATKLAQQINESNRKVGAVVAWFKVQSTFQNLTLPDNANRGLYETLETKVQFKGAQEKAQKEKAKDKDKNQGEALFSVFLLNDCVVVAKKQFRQSLITGGKAVLKSVATVRLSKDTPFKVVANGIDFSNVLVEIESEEKRKIWGKLVAEICS